MTPSSAGQGQVDRGRTFDNLPLPHRQTTTTKRRVTIRPPKMVSSQAFEEYCQAVIDKRSKEEEDKAKERRKMERIEKKRKADDAKRMKAEERTKEKGGKKGKTVTIDPDNDRQTTSKSVDNDTDTNVDMTAQVDHNNVCSIYVGEKDDDFTDWIGCGCGKWFHVGCLSVLDACFKGKSMTEIRGMTYYIIYICVLHDEWVESGGKLIESTVNNV